MIYRIEVLPRARDDLDSLAGWIAKDNLAAAHLLFDEVGEAVQRLARFPRLGPRCRHSARPEMELPAIPLPTFNQILVVYEVLEDAETVVVQRIPHGKRDLTRLI